MASKLWKLIDASDNHHADGWQISKSDLSNAPDDFQIRMRTLRCGLSQSVDVIEGNNGGFRFTLLPTRGMGVWKGWLGDTMIGWNSPVHGPVHPGKRALWQHAKRIAVQVDEAFANFEFIAEMTQGVFGIEPRYFGVQSVHCGISRRTARTGLASAPSIASGKAISS